MPFAIGLRKKRKVLLIVWDIVVVVGEPTLPGYPLDWGGDSTQDLEGNPFGE